MAVPARIGLDPGGLGRLDHGDAMRENILHHIGAAFAQRADGDTMRPGAGDVLDCHVVGAGFESHTVVIVCHTDGRDGDMRAGADVESVSILRRILGVGGCVHAEVLEGNVLRVAFDRVEHVGGVFLAEAGDFDVATASDVKQRGTFIVLIGGKTIVSVSSQLRHQPHR